MIKEELLINLSGIKDKETFHNYVSKKLNFPSYYGRNLDAFWDCITDENQSDMPKILIVEGLDGLKAPLPNLYEGIVKCLRDYLEEFPNREVILR